MEVQPEEHCRVQSRNDKGLDKKLCSMLCQKGPDLSDVVKCKPARSSSLCNVLFEGQLAIEDHTKISDRS